MSDSQETEYEEEQEELSLEEEFKQRYEDEYNKFQLHKEYEEEKSKRNLSKKSMAELVERQYQQTQERILQTEALGSVALVMGGQNFGTFNEAKVTDDNQLVTMVAGKRKEIAVLHQPLLVTINMRKYWVGGGAFWKFRYFIVWITMRMTGMMSIGILRFNVFFVRADGEYTIDPSRDWTPWELQRKLEAYLKIEGKLLKARIKQQLISDQGDEKRFNNLVFAFLIWSAVIIFMFVWTQGS